MPSRLKILNYHNVDTPPSGALLSKLYVTPERFEQQCRLLKRLGLRGVTLSEGLRALARNDAQRLIAFTFDDGYVDNLVHAAPILKKYGFRATCYVVSGKIGDHNAWDAAELNVRKQLMNRAQLSEWLADGNELGAHSVSHAHLHRLSRDAAAEEVTSCRVALWKMTGATIDHFCYPYGEFTDETVEVVRAAGYKSAVTTQRGVATLADDPFRLPRIAVHGGKGLLKFALKAATPYAAFGGSRAA